MRPRRTLTAALGLALAPLPAPATALAGEVDGLALLQARDRQLFETGWRLATANAPWCTGAVSKLGFQVLDAAGFEDADAVRRDLGLAGDLAVGAIASGSPAERAGVLAGDTLIALNGTPLEPRFPRSKPSWQRLIDVTAALEAAAAQGPVTLELARPGAAPRTLTLAPTPACPTRFEVIDRGGKASAEGTRVMLGRDFVGFDYPADEFAAVVAHEFAHNLLGHRRTLDEKGRSLGNVRLTEREADRLMPWLLANAGYDPAAALRFMNRWGPRHDGGLFRNRNHEGWDERAEWIALEVKTIAPLMAAEGQADWRTHFTREQLD